MTTRQQEIQSVHKEYKWFYPFTAGIVILAIGFFLGASLFQGDDNGFSYVTNLYTEIISIGITIVILDRINEYRETQRLKKRLIGEAGGQSNEIAKSAIDWMRREGWLKGDDGLLCGAYLRTANLQGADLRGANIYQAILWDANLQHANLGGANLQKAYLVGANLQDTLILGANLQNTTLVSASFKNARLWGTNLKYANLIEANLEGAHLKGVTLPDGTKWTSDTDTTRFTDPNHPDFWQPPANE